MKPRTARRGIPAIPQRWTTLPRNPGSTIPTRPHTPSAQRTSMLATCSISSASKRAGWSRRLSPARPDGVGRSRRCGDGGRRRCASRRSGQTRSSPTDGTTWPTWTSSYACRTLPTSTSSSRTSQPSRASHRGSTASRTSSSTTRARSRGRTSTAVGGMQS